MMDTDLQTAWLGEEGDTAQEQSGCDTQDQDEWSQSTEDQSLPVYDSSQYHGPLVSKPRLDRTRGDHTNPYNIHYIQDTSQTSGSPESEEEDPKAADLVQTKTDQETDPTLHFEQSHIPRIDYLRNVNREAPTMPVEDRVFEAYKVEYIIKDILETKLKRTFYEPTSCSRLSKELCSLIKDKTKELEYHRYKIVCQVMIGQDTDQSVQIATRCLWNHETDNFAAATFRNSHIYAVAIVYGLLLE